MMNKILIVDDDKHFRLLLARYLKKAGYEDVEFAENSVEGVVKAKNLKPQIAVIDTLLPPSDGFEACREIRDQVPGIKIIMTTGSIDVVDAGKALASGADDYVVKTSDYYHLIEAVKKLFHDEP